ncbi:hypothetical protein CK203_111242 [Vitis vinifera]|uniref:Uncharacterized protein n=1 Tax=Vitis vinifera TaxID=29760 RepID=A0A438BQ53_VITVI|nr:hypothetical protein CK203_111242 [Vitis vinifera]
MGSDVVFSSLYLDRIVSLMMIDLVSPDFLTYHTSGATLGHIPFHLEVYGSSQILHIIITYWMLTETWTWSLPYGALRSIQLVSTSRHLDAIMPLHLGGHLGYVHDSVMDSDDQYYMCDLRIFTYVTCSLIDVLCHLVTDLSCIRCPYWGIFPFQMRFTDFHRGYMCDDRRDLWFFTDVACSMIDDFMPPDFRPIMHMMPYWGIFPFRLRFTDLHGVGSPLVYMIINGYRIHARSTFDFILSGYSEEPLLSHSARFILFDIVVIPGWSRCLGFPRHHFSGPWRRSLSHISVTVSITRPRYIVFTSLTIILELFIDMSSQRSVVRDS